MSNYVCCSACMNSGYPGWLRAFIGFPKGTSVRPMLEVCYSCRGIGEVTPEQDALRNAAMLRETELIFGLTEAQLRERYG